MEVYEEKRRYQRHEHSSPMHMHLMDSQDQYSFAEMKDYCRGGMSLLTNEKLMVGHLVYLEMKNYDEYSTGPEKHKSYFGSVKWASLYSSPDVDTKGSQMYGIEYNEPAGYDG
jgi:hypothetical protein